MYTDPKSAKKTDNLSVFFELSESAHVKAARRRLIKFYSFGIYEKLLR